MPSRGEQSSTDQLNKIKAVSSGQTESDQLSTESATLLADEQANLSQAQLKAILEKYKDQIQAENERFLENTKLRGRYAWALYWLCVGWLVLLTVVRRNSGISQIWIRWSCSYWGVR